jgi:hypothetical protein
MSDENQAIAWWSNVSGAIWNDTDIKDDHLDRISVRLRCEAAWESDQIQPIYYVDVIWHSSPGAEEHREVVDDGDDLQRVLALLRAEGRKQ